MSRVANAEAEKLVAELRARIGSEFDGELHLSEAEAIALFALIESQREDRDSWRRVAERLEEEKRAAEARVTALEAEKAGTVKLADGYGIVLMMIAAGCSDPQRFAKRMLAEYAPEAKKMEATK